MPKNNHNQGLLAQTFEKHGKTLTVMAASLTSGARPSIPDGTEQVWGKLADHVRHDRQVVYVRDIKELSIDGKYPGGYAPNGYEVFVALPSWPVSSRQWIDTIAHELHHVVRWQHGGYGKTLGEALVTEGLACWFAELESGWKAPWIRGDTSAALWKKAQEQWDDPDYKHDEWFFRGPLGKWAGYRMGYVLVRRVLDLRFDLPRSVTLTEQDVRPALNLLVTESS